MKLIGIEWMKLKRLMTMKIILLVYAVLVPVIYFLLSYIQVGPLRIPIQGYQFPDAYQLVGWTAGWFNLMVGVIIIVFTTNEIKYKTQRQNVIDGLSKRDVILSKFFVILGLSIVVTLYTFLIGFVTGVVNGGGGSAMDGIEFIAIYFISTLGYLPALAIVIYIFSTIIEGIVGFIAIQEYVQFFPLTTFAKLSPFPSHFFLQPQPNPYLMDDLGRSLLALFYIFVFMITSFWIIKRRDV